MGQGLPIAIDHVTVPLLFDAYTLLLLTNLGLQASLNCVGSHSGSRQAQALVSIPPGLSPVLAGLTFHHAYVLVHIVDKVVDFTSNAETSTLMP